MENTEIWMNKTSLNEPASSLAVFNDEQHISPLLLINKDAAALYKSSL